MARESVDLKVGDIVNLHIGSPDLTVIHIGDDGYVNVVWMTISPRQKVQSARAPFVCVKKVE